MGYEVDFLAVNSGSGGDAIAVRFGDLNGDREDQFVAVVDGGFTEHGTALVAHIKEHYRTDIVDVAISTHLDRDHIYGLKTVVEELNVGALWMHEPTAGDEEQLALAAKEAKSDRKRAWLQQVTASVSDSRDLASLARDLGINIVAPYTGLTAADGALQVIGPTQAYYESLVPKFRSFKYQDSLVAMVAEGLEKKTGKMLEETLEDEKLEEGAKTEPENNSSVISLIRVDDRAIILTGDAGAEALGLAADYLDGEQFDWSTVKVMQIPHHGSRNNVTPSVLDRYLGAKVQEDRQKQACVSCPKNGEPQHPARRVTNAFHRRGCRVLKTAGSTLSVYHDAPTRGGFVKAEEVPFYDKVD